MSTYVNGYFNCELPSTIPRFERRLKEISSLFLTIAQTDMSTINDNLPNTDYTEDIAWLVNNRYIAKVIQFFYVLTTTHRRLCCLLSN
jgi:hypothetical protein